MTMKYKRSTQHTHRIKNSTQRMFKIGFCKNLGGRIISKKSDSLTLTITVEKQQYMLLAYLAYQNQMTASAIMRELITKTFSEDLEELKQIQTRLSALGKTDEEILQEIRTGFNLNDAVSRAPRKAKETTQDDNSKETSSESRETELPKETPE